MKKINKIVILGETIKVVWQKKPIVDQQGRQLAGYYDHVNRKVVVHQIGNEREDMSTLCHELIHSVLFTTGLSQVISPELNEVICESMSRFIEKNFRLK